MVKMILLCGYLRHYILSENCSILYLSVSMFMLSFFPFFHQLLLSSVWHTEATEEQQKLDALSCGVARALKTLMGLANVTVVQLNPILPLTHT